MSSSQAKLSHYLSVHHSRVLFRDSEGRCLLYGKVAELAETSAFTLAQRRVVLCMVDNDLAGLAGYLGLLTANAIPLMISVGMLSGQLQSLTASYRPGYVWLPESRRAEFAEAVCLIAYDGYCLLHLDFPPYEIHESLALLLGTSGSTGSPQFVRLSHENVWNNAESIAQYLELNGEEIPITTLPPSYTYGLSILHSHVVMGATIAVTKATFFDRSFWQFVREVGATSLGGVPYHYEILERLRFTSMDLPRLRTLTQAGGRMEPAMTRKYATHCASRSMRYFTMYGQVEATARMSYLPSTKAVAKAGSIGVAIPGGRFWLEDQDGHVITEAGVTGELVYQGANVSMGYAKGYEDLAKGDERHGVLRTGDMARRDEDGDYFIVGRLKRFIKLFGHRVNLADVESFLYEEGHVAACVGCDDLLEVYMPHGATGQAQRVKTLVVQHLKVGLKGVVIYEVDVLPRNDAGKVQYAKLRPQNGICLG
ncbi:MAG: AMP-binding protein [Nitrospira sp.]|nr:AMP-binding protein [Nitrospira sp.]MDH4342036.1 AMP-binding protein [Nitrospira sp.]MDH5334703.1 AMP-binding protein [Nitrospira sp.]